MPIIDTPAGTLEVTNAILSASEFRATQKISVSNSAPTKNFSVGDKFHVSTTDADAVNITGNLVAHTLKIGNLLVSPTFDLAAVSNVGNTTSNTLQFANATTSFVASSNVEIGGNITLTSNAQVKVGSNVLAEYTGPHGREPKEMPLKKYPEIAFAEGKFDSNPTTNTFVQAGYTVSASSTQTGVREAWNAFDGGDAMEWRSSGADYTGSGGIYVGTAHRLAATDTDGAAIPYGEWLQIKMPNKILLQSIKLVGDTGFLNKTPEDFKLYGSINGSTWKLLITQTGLTPTTGGNIISPASALSVRYDYYALVTTKLFDANQTDVAIEALEFYGTEEPAPPGDLSLDTTLKSTFNSVRSNNYVMYFDGKYFVPGDGGTSNNLVTGSNKSVIHHNATYDSTGKYWTLDGSTESNVTTGSLGFEGDVPHTVSTWINASNLEANALTQQIFSIGSGYDKAFLKVDDTQIAANTWHNVTYAYQGEGGSKVTYVDGRKVEEAQVEDTFGDYPPFAMTDYETGGYRVSASSEHLTDARLAWRAFDGNPANEGSPPNVWQTMGSTYNTSGNFDIATGNTTKGTFTADGVTYIGEWIKLEIPHKFILNYLKWESSIDNRRPKKGAILGSNDDVNWYTIRAFNNDLTWTIDSAADYAHITSNSNSAYKYVMAVIEQVQGGDGNLWGNGISLYGHKEGDLTRFPEPTRVLKYPHIAMTGPAQRGYVATVSSYYNTGVKPEHAFINEWVSQSNSWQSGPLGNNTTTGSGRYTAGSTFNTAYLSNTPLYGEGGFQTSELSNTWTGEWLQIELPYNLKTTQHIFRNADGNAAWNDSIPTSGVILGSTNGSTWNLIHQFSSTLKDQTIDVSHTTYYKYFRVVGTAVGGSATVMLIPEWELYGVQENTETPMIVGGPFAGKVANFRVYDQYLGDERIQEIYDAQKDEFGHKKSSMTFYKGRVGVGTTEPEGALTVIDEPHALEKFPARAISADDSYDEGIGHIKISSAGYSGGYGGSYDSGYGRVRGFSGSTTAAPSSGGSGFNAFDGLTSTCWSSTPARNTRLSEEVDFGAWLKIQTPESVSLKKAEIECKSDWYQIGSDIVPTWSDPSGTGDDFGRHISCSHDGTRVLISGYTWNTSTGRNTVWDWDGVAWVQVGNFIDGVSHVSGQEPRCGRIHAISGDGNIIAIASPYEQIDGSLYLGAVRVYHLVGSTWTLLPDSGSLTKSSGDGAGGFVGTQVESFLGLGSVELSYDGTTLAINEYGYDDNTTNDVGRVFVYKYSNGAWSYKGTGATQFVGDTADAHFGAGLNMSEDGDHLAIGTLDAGHFVEVYKWGGSSWGIKGARINYPGSGADGFGRQVCLSNDGNILAVGAYNADIAEGAQSDNTGLVYMYHYDSTASPQWVLHTTLKNRDHQGDDDFGAKVQLSGDGKKLLVAVANWPDGADQGIMYMYHYHNNVWSLQLPIKKHSAAGVGPGHYLGYSYGTGKSANLSRDGNVIFGGELGFNSGAGRARVWISPGNIKNIWGSNDNKNWTRITTTPTREEATSNVAGVAFGYDNRVEFKNLDNPNYYKYHAIVADAFTRLKDVKLFGVRNQGSSTLHDGTLTLTKNLDVPRIGPPPDADDTPQRDRLVVEYNTHKNPLEDGLVKDTSGRGNDGTLTGVVYNPEHKSFDFSGVSSSSKITATLPSTFAGNQPITVSVWFKRYNDLATENTIWRIGPRTDEKCLGLAVSGGNFNFFGNDSTDGLFSSTTFINGGYTVGRWYHVACIYDGSSRYIFIDSVRDGTTVTNTLDFNPSTELVLGFNGVNKYLNGSIANFRLFNRALTTEEVKTLYDMGRCSNAIPKTLHIMGGMMRYNNDIGKLQIHNGMRWSTIGGTIVTGGTRSTFGDYALHVFTESGTFNVENAEGVYIDILIVAGGGSGGNVTNGGGGGAGGVRLAQNYFLSGGSYTVVVGAGGATNGTGGIKGNNGVSSSFGTTTTQGGGGGGEYGISGANGGSGGGGGANTGTTNGGAGQQSTTADGLFIGYGNNGGNTSGTSSNRAGGGGGGAGGAGGVNNGSIPGVGGAGLDLSGTFGTNVGDSGYFASGGHGQNRQDAGRIYQGVPGGGGGIVPVASQTTDSILLRSGLPNTGGGGHGGYGGGNGGSGVVIIRYLA